MNPIPKTMRGVYLTGHGGTDCLEYREDIPTPQPGPRDLLIRVAAAGVNNTDLNTRKAWYSKGDQSSQDAAWTGEPLGFPRIQGIDVCGTVVAVGSDVDPARLGERVLVEPCLWEVNGRQLDSPWFLGSECDGGFADYLAVAARHAYAVESDLSDIELASFPCSYSTAENLLTRSGVRSGESVLVTGASGGVGSAAVQLARARGARVIACASASKRQALVELGAEDVVPRGDNLIDALGRNSVDVVIDLVAGEQWPQLLEVLRPFGRYAVSGAIGGAFVTLDVRTLYLKDLRLLGCTVLEPGVFANLVHRIETRQIRPLVAKTFALRDIAAAQDFFESKQYVGKIVLDLGQPAPARSA